MHRFPRALMVLILIMVVTGLVLASVATVR